MQDFILAQREQIAELCRTHHVLRLSIFGSAARDDFNSDISDVDVIVEFDQMPIEYYARNKRALDDELTRIFGRSVDPADMEEPEKSLHAGRNRALERAFVCRVILSFI